jgi:hypothetical protein
LNIQSTLDNFIRTACGRCSQPSGNRIQKRCSKLSTLIRVCASRSNWAARARSTGGRKGVARRSSFIRKLEAAKSFSYTPSLRAFRGRVIALASASSNDLRFNVSS